MIRKAKWFLVGLLWLLLWSTSACDREDDWREYNTAGMKAYQRADYVDAERLLSAALEEAEEFGVEDPRFATSLNNLAGLYQNQGRYAEAEPLYQRALAIREKALGPEHPSVAQSLENYAALLRETARADEAERMETRAKAIRAKYE